MKLFSLEETFNLNIDEVKNLYKTNVSPAQVKLLSAFSFGKDLSDTSEGCYIFTKVEKILDFTGGFGVLNHGHNNQGINEDKFFRKEKVEVHQKS